ncbi:nucleolar complex protein 2 homolog [Lates japonicus]|uniref:Nucleolar complex protein 2 homolog n=1 Tax=Lates japonicus TaxID=270547 RepID=A0AAD3M1P9_LATJO|nr:nucleolar complex protein 2 homolog [Lates japonicus]
MAGKQKRKLEDLSVDEFLLSGFDSAGEGDSEDETPKQNGLKKKNKKKDVSSAAAPKIDDKKKGKASEHKEQLSRLKNKDPDFYKFLQENDQTLLNFDDTDSSDNEDERMYHNLPSTLEEASSGEDDEEEVTQAFKAAVATTKGEGGGQCRYKVADSSVFNVLVLFCIRDIYVALQRMLSLKPDKDQKKCTLDTQATYQHAFIYIPTAGHPPQKRHDYEEKVTLKPWKMEWGLGMAFKTQSPESALPKELLRQWQGGQGLGDGGGG